MKIFNKQELKAVSIILLAIFILSFFNFQISLRRGRDNERENDLGDIAKLLDAYKSKNSIYPANLSNLTNAPKDPGTTNGHSYLYLTDGKFFQLFASLEGGSDESQYNPVIVKRNLKCGSFICNFGVASSNTPLDISLSMYENEINARNKNK